MAEYIYGTDEHEGHWLTGEEIVRCGDCEHYEPRAKDGVCNRSKFIQMYAKADGFCAWGSRKEDA